MQRKQGKPVSVGGDSQQGREEYDPEYRQIILHQGSSEIRQQQRRGYGCAKRKQERPSADFDLQAALDRTERGLVSVLAGSNQERELCLDILSARLAARYA